MKGIVTWFVKNSVPANLFMFFLIFGGFFVSYPSMKSEFFPIPDLNTISISIPYPGASAKEVESSISSKIEDRLEGVSNIKKLRSYSLEGAGLVSVQVFNTNEIDTTLDDIKTIIDGISTFPQNSEAPIVSKKEVDEKIMDVIIYGDVDEKTLLAITKEVNREIKELGEVSFTEINGSRNKEITIEVSEKNLEKYDLSFDQISRAINSGSIDLPGGLLSSKSGDLLIRTVGQSYNANEYENIVIKSQKDGSQLLLKDIANITDGFVDVERYYRWDGVQAMFVSANLVGDQDVLLAAKQIRKYVEQKKPDMPSNVNIDYWYDQARYLQDRIDLLYNNFAIGIILVLFLLTMFLRPSVAFWVSMGIPISFGGALYFLISVLL